jgi:hypothetical protein
MGIVINDNLITYSPKPLDDRYGLYNSVALANAAIISSVRYIGLTVGIKTVGGVDDYWYYAGITDGDLVLKSSGGGGSGISGLSGISGIAGAASTDCISYTISIDGCGETPTTIDFGYTDCIGNHIADSLIWDTITGKTFCAKANTIEVNTPVGCHEPIVTNNGSCATNGCDYDYMLIASHSTSYILNTNEQYNYYYGNDVCGWDSCDLNLSYQYTRGETDPIPQAYGNCGIPLPIDLQVGDIVELCGHAYCGAADNGDTFDTNVEYFSCDDVTGGTSDFVGKLFMVPNASTFNNHYTCFSNSVTIGNANALPECSTFLLVGLGATFGTIGLYNQIKATWTLSIKRLCNTNAVDAPMGLTKGAGFANECDAVKDGDAGLFPNSLYYNPVGAVWSYGAANSVNQFFTDAAKTIPFDGGNFWYYSNVATNRCALQIDTSGYVVDQFCC